MSLDELQEQPEVQEEAKQDDDLKGFVSKEDWVASGKKEEDWRDPVEYKHRGELIRLKKELTQSFESQIKNLNAYHEIQLKQEREELLKLRDDAIDTANKAEVKRLDAKIAANELASDKLAMNVQMQKPAEIIEWEEEHPWINNPNDPRVDIANKILDSHLKSGKTLATALRLLDKELDKLEEPKRQNSQIVEPSRTSGGKREAPGLGWGDLTAQEIKVFEAGLFKGDKKAFLKAVENSRVK